MFNYTFNKIVIIVTVILILISIFSNITLNTVYIRKSIGQRISVFINTFIRKQEEAYVIKMNTNSIHPLMRKFNILMARLKMEMPLFSPFPLTLFKYFIYFVSFIASFTISLLVFNNIFLIVPLFAIVIITIICGLFSITIKSRLKRIIDCIECENLLAANVASSSFLLNVKRSLESIPLTLKKSYSQYITNIEMLNYNSEEALNLLDAETGYFSHDFISNINIYENYRVKGFENIFKDVAELNNIRKLARDRMDFIIKKISKDFLIAFLISYGSLIAEIVLSEVLSKFYFKNTVGQIIFIIDLLLLAYMYLRINMLKATEL